MLEDSGGVLDYRDCKRMLSMIAIIDYGLGNLRSVAGAVAKLGFEPQITDRVDALTTAEKLILPGVGAFGDGMANLRERNLIEPLAELVIRQRKPILGICLGAQLLARSSEEFGHHAGLGWIDAVAVKLAPGAEYRLPHVGWNELVQACPSPLFDGIPTDALFYYVHSFHVRASDPEIVVGTCSYGAEVFAAAIKWGNIVATQFHPEKSQQHGLQLLKNFLQMKDHGKTKDTAARKEILISKS